MKHVIYFLTEPKSDPSPFPQIIRGRTPQVLERAISYLARGAPVGRQLVFHFTLLENFYKISYWHSPKVLGSSSSFY